MRSITRVARTALRFAAIACCAVPALAQAGTFSDWQLNGDAALLEDDSVLRIAPLGSFRVGSAWAPTQLSLLENFSVAFSFQIAEGSGADGFTITFQNSEEGSGALGEGGGFLGYQGIDLSVAFVYDTFDNGFETDDAPGHNTAVTTDGNLVDPGLGAGSHPIDINGGSLRETILFSWVDYDATSGLFSMYLNDVDTKPDTAKEEITGDWASVLGDNVFVGFTSATGSLDDNHDILSFSVSTTPVPLPAAVWLLATGVSALGAVSRRRRGA